MSTSSPNRFSAIKTTQLPGFAIHHTSGITAGDTSPYDTAAQTELVFEKILQLLKTQGASLSDIVKITVFLTDIREYDVYNAVRNRLFKDIENPPASTCVEALLNAPGKRVEIEAIAIVKS